MTIAQWIRTYQKQLEQAGIGTARLDCLVLLEDALGKDRASLLAHSESILQEQILQKLATQLNRRINHEPLAFIRGKTEFYGREFSIDNDVLEPRPESETMIECLKTLQNIRTIADIGTGSGALAITSSLEIQKAILYATDIDPKCLAVAKKNQTKHGTTVAFYEGNLLEPLAAVQLDVLLCNLPYVPDDYHINDAASLEPRLAIFGGKDGLEYYRTLFQQIDLRRDKPRYVLTESLPFQHKDLQNIARKYGYNQKNEEDFIQIFSGS